MAWLVKHDKPNFLGNQPLARIAKSGPKQKLVGFKLVTAGVVPEEGLQIVRKKDGRISNIEYPNLEIIGWVTSCRFSPTLNEVIGLCWLPVEVAEKAKGVPGVTDAKVDVVWDPPWSRERMSEAARLQLGMF